MKTPKKILMVAALAAGTAGNLPAAKEIWQPAQCWEVYSNRVRDCSAWLRGDEGVLGTVLYDRCMSSAAKKRTTCLAETGN